MKKREVESMKKQKFDDNVLRAFQNNIRKRTLDEESERTNIKKTKISVEIQEAGHCVASVEQFITRFQGDEVMNKILAEQLPNIRRRLNDRTFFDKQMIHAYYDSLVKRKIINPAQFVVPASMDKTQCRCLIILAVWEAMRNKETETKNGGENLVDLMSNLKLVKKSKNGFLKLEDKESSFRPL